MYLLLFLAALLSLISVKCAMFVKCNWDADCQDGYSCIENICKVCVKCSLIFRRGNCEIDFNNCGDCLEGYKEISVTDNSTVKKPCKPIKKKGNLKECSTNDNCPPDNYCSEMSCFNCFDCSLINRLKPEKCARDPAECGPCFIGYLSIHSKMSNYNKCVKVPPDPESHYISSGSTLVACIIIVAYGVVAFVKYHIKHLRGVQHKTQEVQQKTQEVQHKTQEVQQKTQEVQHAKVYQWPYASYYLKDVGSDGISEPDAGPSESSNVPDKSNSAERGEIIILSHRSDISASSSLSEGNSITSGSDSQDEQPIDVNVLNNESADSQFSYCNNSHLVTDNEAQVPEDPAKEPTMRTCH